MQWLTNSNRAPRILRGHWICNLKVAHKNRPHKENIAISISHDLKNFFKSWFRFAIDNRGHTNKWAYNWIMWYTINHGTGEINFLLSSIHQSSWLWYCLLDNSNKLFLYGNTVSLKCGLTLTAMLRSTMLTLVLRCQQTCISVLVLCWICLSTLSASESSDISDEPSTNIDSYRVFHQSQPIGLAYQQSY